MATEKAELILAFESELLRQAFSALAARDRRFRLTDTRLMQPANDPTRCKPVALSHDCPDLGVPVHILKARGAFGVVLLCGASTLANEALNLPGLLPARVPWDASWSQVAAALLEVYRDTNPGSALPRVESGVPSGAENLGLKALTRRETDVLQLVAEGHSAREMAEKLHLAESTIDNHKSSLLRKFGVRKSIELARIAYRLGIVIP